MRIALDSKRAYHNNRGLGNYSRDIIRLLSAYMPEAELLLMNPKASARQIDYDHCEEVLPQGLWRMTPSLWRSMGVCNDIKRLQADIYWGLSGELPLGIGKVSCRRMVTMHDLIFMRYPHLYSPTYRYLFEQKNRYALKVADTVVAISEQTKRDLIDLLGADEKKIQVVYQGCHKQFREPISEELCQQIREQYQLPNDYLITVGALEPRKNLEGLLKAIWAAKLDVPVVAVGGQSAYGDEMQMLAGKLGIKLIQLHGVPFQQFPALYKMARVNVYPSLFEGFGIPILESLCVGTPVVTSTGSCFAETGGLAALYADPLQPDDLGEQLRRALSDESLRQQMISQGHLQAEKFTDAAVAKSIINVLNHKS